MGIFAHFLYVEKYMEKNQTALGHQLASLVQAMGYEFVGVELQGKVLRLYIDNEKGVTIEDCSRVSYQVRAMLAVDYPLESRYSLEVSSPGLDRPLFELEQYQRQIGKKVKLKLFTKLQNQRKFVGKLLRVEGNNIHLLVEAEEVVLPFSEIEKANVIADIR